MKTVKVDVVIVGSGAGGGCVAQELAPLVEKGKRILVLERGGRFRDEEFDGREVEMAEAHYLESGGFLTADGAMTLAVGNAYGGSTVVYTGTSLRPPARVIEGWGVPDLTHPDLVRRALKYSDQNNVHKLPEAELNDNNRLFVEGAKAAGFPTDLWTCPRVTQLIQARFGVRHHVDHISRFLHLLGWSPQKPQRRAAANVMSQPSDVGQSRPGLV